MPRIAINKVAVSALRLEHIGKCMRGLHIRRCVVSSFAAIALIGTVGRAAAQDSPAVPADQRGPLVLGAWIGRTGVTDQNIHQGAVDLAAGVEVLLTRHWSLRVHAGQAGWDTEGHGTSPFFPPDRVTVRRIVVEAVGSVTPQRFGLYWLAGFGAYNYRFDISAVTSTRGGVHTGAGIMFPLRDRRLALTTELRVHFPRGPGNSPVVAHILYTYVVSAGINVFL